MGTKGVQGGRAGWGLLLIDFINDLDFEGGAQLMEPALEAARAAAQLKRRARAAGASVIYVNDNFRRWRSDFRQVVAHCREEACRGRPLVERLLPDPDDYFVLKPRNSGFFQTPLKLLLDELDVGRLVLCGLTADNCVFQTASDGYLHDLEVFIVRDAVASIDERDKAMSLELMHKVLKAKLVDSQDFGFD